MEVHTTSCSPSLHSNIFCTGVHMGNTKRDNKLHLHDYGGIIRYNHIHIDTRYQVMANTYNNEKNK